MRAHEFAELTTFEAVARLLSFSKAAADLGVSAATVSQTIRSLETKLGVRLLNRTTRSVSVTEAGEQLLTRLQPALASVDDAIQVVSTFRESPIGTLRYAHPSLLHLPRQFVYPFDPDSEILARVEDDGLHIEGMPR